MKYYFHSDSTLTSSKANGLFISHSPPKINKTTYSLTIHNYIISCINVFCPFCCQQSWQDRPVILIWVASRNTSVQHCRFRYVCLRFRAVLHFGKHGLLSLFCIIAQETIHYVLLRCSELKTATLAKHTNTHPISCLSLLTSLKFSFVFF